MKVVETLKAFPAKAPLKGLPLEAYSILQNVDKDKPVMRVSLEGHNAAAVKRAFVAAAKVLGGAVETRNADDGGILVRWSERPAAPRGRRAGEASRRVEHDAASVAAEMRRLWQEKGERGSYEQADSTMRRKLEISAKRNLSRRANKG